MAKIVVCYDVSFLRTPPRWGYFLKLTPGFSIKFTVTPLEFSIFCTPWESMFLLNFWCAPLEFQRLIIYPLEFSIDILNRMFFSEKEILRDKIIIINIVINFPFFFEACGDKSKYCAIMSTSYCNNAVMKMRCQAKCGLCGSGSSSKYPWLLWFLRTRQRNYFLHILQLNISNKGKVEKSKNK